MNHKDTFASCHPDRKHYARDLCKSCYNSKSRSNNPGLRKKHDAKYRERNQEKVKASRRRWEIKHPHYRDEKRIKDPNFRLRGNLRTRINRAIEIGSRSGSAVRDLGCSIPHFKLYIENQFEGGMSWDNWGRGKGKWNLDHVIPLASFDLSNRQQFLEACNWLNYQPLWATENSRKGGGISK